ncbi:hypothetical protein VNO77_10535 [Canavalia gladiata]|uniref:Uncharacterized protein n=1 Tax=Canavalia gladiata TaxID=3824 RepID=A0AAN9MB58_CANGL
MFISFSATFLAHSPLFINFNNSFPPKPKFSSINKNAEFEMLCTRIASLWPAITAAVSSTFDVHIINQSSSGRFI